MMYEGFARLYEQLMPKALYRDWVTYMTLYLPEGKSSLDACQVLDLGCGAGNLAKALLATYENLNYTGVDLSQQMIDLASSKQLSAEFSVQSMTDLAKLGQFDTVVSFCDSLCYLVDSPWQSVFQQVYDHLRDGGVFLFDCHSLGTLHEFDGFLYHDSNEQGAVLWSSELANPDTVQHHLEIFLKQADGKYERSVEDHFETTYSISEIVQWLYEVGFYTVYPSSAFDQEPASDESGRLFFAAYKYKNG